MDIEDLQASLLLTKFYISAQGFHGGCPDGNISKRKRQQNRKKKDDDWLAGKNLTEEERNALEEIRKERTEYRARMNKNLKKYREKYGEYWTGPLGIQIPLCMRSVPDVGGSYTVNYNLEDDGELTIVKKENMTKGGGYKEDKYLEHFGDLRDGVYYWKDCDPGDFEVSF